MNDSLNMPRTAPKAFGYIRFSKDDQKKGRSLERQKECVKTFSEKNGPGPADVIKYQDLGVSGFRGLNAEKDNALARLLRDVEETGKIKKGDWVIVENIDRLSRQSPQNTWALINRLTTRGVTFATVNNGQIYKGGEELPFMGLMTMILESHLSNEESVKKQGRLCDRWTTKRAAIADGKKMTARAPSWLTLSKDKMAFSVVEERAAIVRRIFDETIEGRGCSSIVKRLNAENVPPFRGAKGWVIMTVKGVLRSRAVIGEFTPCKMEKGKRVPVGEPFPDYFPRIITDGQFYAAQSVVKKRTNAGGRSVASVNCLFSRICFCGQCGGPMHYVDKGRGAVYLRCDWTARNLEKCKPMSRKYAPIEAAFIRWIVNFDFTGTTKGERATMVSALAAAEGGAADATKRLLRHAEVMAGSDDLVSTFTPLFEKEKANADRLTKEAERLKAELATISDKNPNVDAKEAAKNPENRYRLREEIRQRVNRLVVMKDGRLRVELKNGLVIDALDEKSLSFSTDLAALDEKTHAVWKGLRSGRPTRLIFQR